MKCKYPVRAASGLCCAKGHPLPPLRTCDEPVGPNSEYCEHHTKVLEIHCGPAPSPGAANVQAPLQTPRAGPTYRGDLVSEVADGRWVYEARKRRATALVGG